MTTQKHTRLVILISLGGLLALAGGLCVFREPAPPPAPGIACASTADCGPGHRCVAPGRCSQACKTEGDCPPGRTCAELRLMDPERDGRSAGGIVTTCVVATPP